MIAQACDIDPAVVDPVVQRAVPASMFWCQRLQPAGEFLFATDAAVFAGLYHFARICSAWRWPISSPTRTSPCNANARRGYRLPG